MRKILLAASAGLFLFAVSCKNESNKMASSNSSSKAQKNLESARTIVDAYKTGDISKIDGVVSPDFVDHRPEGDIEGIDSLKKSVQWVNANMGDMKSEVTREWADDEYVALWMKYSGNNKVAMPGMPLGPYTWSIIELTKYKDGKATEHWAFTEAQTISKMMPAVDDGASQQ